MKCDYCHENFEEEEDTKIHSNILFFECKNCGGSNSRTEFEMSLVGKKVEVKLVELYRIVKKAGGGNPRSYDVGIDYETNELWLFSHYNGRKIAKLDLFGELGKKVTEERGNVR